MATGLLRLCGRDPETEDDEEVWVAVMMIADTMHTMRTGPADILAGIESLVEALARAMSRRR